MYSSVRGTRAASVSAAPYIAIVKSEPAARNQRTPCAGDVEVDAARAGDTEQDADLQRGDGERDDEVREHEQRSRDRRGEELPLRTRLAIDEHADPGEHRVQRDQQADRAGGDVRLVRRARVQRLLERRGDHECEQDRVSTAGRPARAAFVR